MPYHLATGPRWDEEWYMRGGGRSARRAGSAPMCTSATQVVHLHIGGRAPSTGRHADRGTIPGMYDADLAAFHDAHAGHLAAEAATTLVDELAAAGHHEGVVVDLGCGSGILAEILIESGYEVLAIDPSPAFLAMVRQRAPRAARIQATVADAVLPDWLVGIACVGEVLSYDLTIDLDTTLESFQRALRPGGVLLFDVPGPGRHAEEGWAVHDEREGFLAMRTEESGFRLHRHITMFSAMTDGAYRRSDTDHELRLYIGDDVRTALVRAGFTGIRTLERYGASGPAFGEGWAGFLAQRPA